MGALVDAARARAVSARSCAEIPVDVPAGCVSDLSCDAERGELGGRTVLVVDGDSVCGPVAILVLRDHHRDGERLETIAGERDADVPTAWTSRVERGTLVYCVPPSARDYSSLMTASAYVMARTDCQ